MRNRTKCMSSVPFKKSIVWPKKYYQQGGILCCSFIAQSTMHLAFPLLLKQMCLYVCVGVLACVLCVRGTSLGFSDPPQRVKSLWEGFYLVPVNVQGVAKSRRLTHWLVPYTWRFWLQLPAVEGHPVNKWSLAAVKKQAFYK